MLTFLGDWITHEPATVTESLTRFIGGSGYDLLTLRADLARFTFLLTEADADHLFGTSTRP